MNDRMKEPVRSNPDGPLKWPRSWLQEVHRCIGWRLVLILTGALVTLLGLSGWVAVELHRKHLVSLLEETAIGLGETIISSAHSSMLVNDRHHLEQIVQNIGSRDQVTALRLLDAHGEIRFSSRPEEVGQTSDLEAPLCRGCHGGAQVVSPQTLRDGLQLYSMQPGEGALGLGVPILNEPGCSTASCHFHPADQRVLGMIDLELSTVMIDRSLTAARRQRAGFAALTIVVISVSLGWLAWRVVHRPVHALLTGTRRVGAGDLSYRIPEIGSGELGELGDSFNEMSARLETALAELETWNRTLESKVEEKTRELERTRDQMVFAEKMASLGKLAAIVAHEINNPLAGVLVYTKLVRRQLGSLGGDGDGHAERVQAMDEKLNTVEHEIARCGDIVRNLLMFSRNREARRTPEDVNEILHRALRLVQHKADLCEVTTELDLDPDLPSVICEAAQIQQAVLALILNGLEAMPDEGTLTVRSRCLEATGEVSIEIADTGSGIPAEIREKIFEPFFSTKSEGKGTGLGLSVVYGIMHRHEGRIEYETASGQGTTFWLILPQRPSRKAHEHPAATGIEGGRPA